MDIAVMTLCTGLIAANLYYCQPLLLLISKEFDIPPGVTGRLNAITQLGYATGLFFLVPLGDLVERKRQILIITVLTIISLLAAAFAQSFLLLSIASFFIGFSTIVAQLILPLAAHLADPERRGKVIGTVMSGLLLGILLSRTVSGVLGAWLGWRAVFIIAAVICTVLFIIMAVRFPESKPDFDGSYGTLMKSLGGFLKMPALQEACILNAINFGIFGAFWTTIVLYLASAQFGFNSATIGLFGLAGAVGALAAPLVGRVGDKGSAKTTILIGLGIILLSFGVFYFFSASIAGIIAGTILLDLSIASCHVSNQTRVYSLIPAARNRLNTLYMTITFIGTALGSATGLWLWNSYGWTGFCVGGTFITIVALGVYLVYNRKTAGIN